MKTQDGPIQRSTAAHAVPTPAPGLGPSVFAVAPVAPATDAMPVGDGLLAAQAFLATLDDPASRWGRWERRQAAAGPTLEACSGHGQQWVAGVSWHPLLSAVHCAYAGHRPLVLSPDMIWLLVAQGFAQHVKANADALRGQFVAHEGRAAIVVRRDDFVKGSQANPWPEVFEAFSDHLCERIGPATHALLQPTFSTTGGVERAAAQIALMDTLQSYFDYELITLCGIPQITLEGTVADWQLLAARVRDLGLFDLRWWTRLLDPILQQFIAAASGRVDTRFWRCIYKQDGGSGGPFVTGWITAFFPYLIDEETGQAMVRNLWLTSGPLRRWRLFHPLPRIQLARTGHGPTTAVFPKGVSQAPFTWNYLGQPLDMALLAGFFGMRQDPVTLALRPQIGWAVREIAAAEVSVAVVANDAGVDE